MRRATWALALGLTFANYALPQEPAPTETNKEAEEHDPLLMWKWINFGILVLGLGYLIGKAAPPLFAKRRQEIEQALVDAARVKQESDAQAAAIDQRFAGLQKEIEDLRLNAGGEIAKESERLGRETEQHLAKIQEQAVQEIALMTRGAREELRRYSAGLALDLAEQRLQSRVTKPEQDALAQGFVRDLRNRSLQ